MQAYRSQDGSAAPRTMLEQTGSRAAMSKTQIRRTSARGLKALVRVAGAQSG
jgi:hypothetical protein